MEERAARCSITLFATLFAGQAPNAQHALIGSVVSALKAPASLTSGVAAARAVARTMLVQRQASRPQLVAALRAALLPSVADLDRDTRRAAIDALTTLAALDGGDVLARELVAVVEGTLANNTGNAANKSGCASLLGSLARSVGGLRARAFVQTSASLLLKLLHEHIDHSVGDNAIVLEAALSALWHTIDATGPAFSPHARATLASTARLALRTGPLDVVLVDSQRGTVFFFFFLSQIIFML